MALIFFWLSAAIKDGVMRTFKRPVSPAGACMRRIRTTSPYSPTRGSSRAVDHPRRGCRILAPVTIDMARPVLSCLMQPNTGGELGGDGFFLIPFPRKLAGQWGYAFAEKLPG